MSLARRLGGALPALAAAGSAGLPAWLQPLLGQAGVRHRSALSVAQDEDAEARPADDPWWQEVHTAESGGGGGGRGGGGEYAGQRARQPAEERLDAPIDAPRTLQDYQRMVVALSRRKKAYLIRDVVEEMSLNGVRPDRFLLHSGLFSCMRNRKLADAMFFFEEMKRRGMEPGGDVYGAAISACGRGGYLTKALSLRDEMLARGMPMTDQIRLALLQVLAEAGKPEPTRELLQELVESGFGPIEFAFAGMANCFRHMQSRSVPKDAERQLLEVLEQYEAVWAEYEGAHLDEARAAAADAGWGDGGGGGAGGGAGGAGAEWEQQSGAAASAGRLAVRRSDGQEPYSPRLVVWNAVINSLAELGFHASAVSLFKRMEPEGLRPDPSTYANIIRSYLREALGRHRQPQNEHLTATLTKRLRQTDLQPYIQEVLEENPSLKLALEEARELNHAGAGPARAAPAAAAAAAAGPGAAAPEAEAAGLLESEEEEEREPGAAALEALQAARGGVDEDASVAVERGQDGAAAAAAGQRQERRAPHHKGPQSAAELVALVRGKAEYRARSKLRFELFKEHLDIDAWYEALHTFQAVLDQQLILGPDISYALLKASLDMQAAGIEHALDVAHTVMDTFERQGLFIDAENGTDALQLAVRRDVGDLTLAHRVYDNMKRTGRSPHTPCLFKYMRALVQREPESQLRILEVCNRICSDSDKADKTMMMKREAQRQRGYAMTTLSPAEQEQHAQQERQARGRQERGGRRLSDGHKWGARK